MKGFMLKQFMILLLLFVATVNCQEDDEEALVKLAVLMPEGDKFNETYQGLFEELEEEYEISKVMLNSEKPEENITELEKINPVGIVLMENKSLKVARKFQKESKILKSKPIFPVMALQLEQSIEGLNNVTGIKFEIPAYTIFSNVKYISKKKFKYVLTFYRSSFQPLIDQSKKMLAKENLVLNAICVDCEGEAMDPKKLSKRLKKAFKKADKDDEADIVWVLADNVLLKASLAGFWAPKVFKKKVPYVAPLEAWVKGDTYGGMIAFNPDYRNLGSQLADKVREIIEDGEGVVEENTVEELISVSGVLNKKRADKVGWKLTEENLDRLQKIYE